MKKKDVKEKVDHAILNDSAMTYEMIEKGVKTDLESLQAVVLSLLSSPPVLKAMVDEHWRRYNEYHAKRKAMREQQPELDLNAEANV